MRWPTFSCSKHSSKLWYLQHPVTTQTCSPASRFSITSSWCWFILQNTTFLVGPWKQRVTELNPEDVLRWTVGGMMIHPFCWGFSLYVWAGPTICPHSLPCQRPFHIFLAWHCACPCQSWNNLLHWNYSRKDVTPTLAGVIVREKCKTKSWQYLGVIVWLTNDQQ